MVAIIKYRETFRGMTNVAYEEICDPNKKGKRLSKDEAKKRIKELGLVKTHSDESGIIWDTPNKEFYEKFKEITIIDL